MAMTEQYYTIDGQMIAYESGGTRKDFLTDNLGSVTAEIDQTGMNRTFDGRYRPYGNSLWSSGVRGVYGWIGTRGYRNTGLAESSLYVRARHYESKSGAWTTQDPVWPTLSAFAYVRGHVTKAVDPLGLFDWDLYVWLEIALNGGATVIDGVFYGWGTFVIGGNYGGGDRNSGSRGGGGGTRGRGGSCGTGRGSSDPSGPPCDQPEHRINGVKIAYWATCGGNCLLDQLAPMCWDILKGFEKGTSNWDILIKYVQCAKDVFLLLYSEVEVSELLENMEKLADAVRCFSDCIKEAPNLDEPASWQYCSSGSAKLPGESCDECCNRLASMQPWNTDCITCCEEEAGPPSESGHSGPPGYTGSGRAR